MTIWLTGTPTINSLNILISCTESAFRSNILIIYCRCTLELIRCWMTMAAAVYIPCLCAWFFRFIHQANWPKSGHVNWSSYFNPGLSSFSQPGGIDAAFLNITKTSLADPFCVGIIKCTFNFSFLHRIAWSKWNVYAAGYVYHCMRWSISYNIS